jgi:hypothetical protein
MKGNNFFALEKLKSSEIAYLVDNLVLKMFFLMGLKSWEMDNTKIIHLIFNWAKTLAVVFPYLFYITGQKL